MSSAVTLQEPATVVARARVSIVSRPCPTFARITFRGPDLEAFGTPGRTFDQRIKVIFPPQGGDLPELSTSSDWYANWLAMPEPARGAMRTYSIRDVSVDECGTEVVVDFVLHTVPGSTGPASLWADAAAVGDEVLLVGPRRGRFDGGGIEFEPGGAARVLLAGDETAAPAIARILEDAAPDLVGDAFIEMPGVSETLSIKAPKGVNVHWLGRAQAAPGEVLVPSVLRRLGAAAGAPELRLVGIADALRLSRGMADPELMWETPQYSALGEQLDAQPAESAEGALSDRYFWIAGESGVVTRLRRHLVRDLGVHRSRVAFMGYWREGVAMR